METIIGFDIGGMRAQILTNFRYISGYTKTAVPMEVVLLYESNQYQAFIVEGHRDMHGKLIHEIHLSGSREASLVTAYMNLLQRSATLVGESLHSVAPS